MSFFMGGEMDPKYGITIGYGLDFLGFVVLFLSGAFDSKYKSSLAAVGSLIKEKELLKNTFQSLQSVRAMSISRDHITGAPNIGTTITDPDSLSQLQDDISARDTQILDLQDKHEHEFRFYLLIFDKASHVGVLFVIFGLLFQWWFSTFGAT
jgi:hypothetical protein